MRENRIKQHFEEEAKEYDSIIQKLIPEYTNMVDALVQAIPFTAEDSFTAIDLGCGTGTIAATIQKHFLGAKLTCLDIAGTMLELAKAKTAGKGTYIHADLNTFNFSIKFDVIVSSLALHHLESDVEKLACYKKIYDALPSGGFFGNIDVILGADSSIQKMYMQQWKKFMVSHVPESEVEGRWLPNYYAEDRPTTLMNHITMLQQAGFSCIDVLYKHYNFMAYIAKK